MDAKNFSGFNRKDLSSADHILEELAEMIMISSEAETGSIEKIEAERRIYELEDEIDIRGAARYEMDMEEPIPSLVSREKLLAVTDRFGIALIGWNEEILKEWDLPLENRWYRDDNTWHSADEENPYTEVVEKFDVLLKDIKTLCENIDEDYEEQSYYLDNILQAMKTCEACWNAKKRSGITGESKFFASVSSENNASFVSSVYLDLLSVSDDKHIPASHFKDAMEHLHLYAREAALSFIAKENSIEGKDHKTAMCLLGAGSACIIRVADNIWRSKTQQNITEEIYSRYLALKGRAYEHVYQSPSFLPEEIENIDLDAANTYRDASIFGTDA